MEKYISQDLPDLFKKEVFQYFGKEIFSSQPEPTQKFLIKSSIIDPIESGFMRDFIGMENTEEILRDHARRNLFVQSFYDEKKGWLFRYHQLFRNFLKAKFESTMGDEERRPLFLKAGTLYEQRGELLNSMKYFLEAKAYPQAVSSMEQLGMDLLRNGRREDLSRWVLVFPDHIREENPWLLFYQAMARQFMVGKENVISIEKAYNLFKQKGDTKGILTSLAQLIRASIYSGVHLVPLGQLIKEGEVLLQSVDLDKYQYESAVLRHYIGSGHIFGEGDLRKRIWACQNAYLIAKQLKDRRLQVLTLVLSSLGLVFVGEFSLAEEACKKIGKITEKSGWSEIEALQLISNSVLANYQGDFIKAQNLVEKLQGEIEKYGFVLISPWIYEISGNLKVARGEFKEAEEIGNSYLSAAISLKNAFLKGLAFRLLGSIYLRQGYFKKAKEALDRSMDALSMEAPSTYELNRTKIAMALVCFHLKEYKRAVKELDEALQYFSSISSHISLSEVHFATAFLLQDQGMNEDATSHLRTGFKIAEERKYEYFYTLGTKYLMKACLLALELKVEGAMDYAAHLLSTRLSSLAEEELKILSNHPSLEVRRKVWEIMRTIHRSKVPPLRIETLGRFQVFRGNSPIEENQWDRIQPKQLLKAIVSYGGQRIPKEILIDELWPEERPQAAEKNFKTTLQRLRKSLEPFIHKDFSSSYIHLHDNIVFLDPELCRVDVDQFLSFLKMADEKEKRGDTKGAISLYTEATEIYRGDFIPEELYAPWVDKTREELRGKYMGLLNKMANLYEKQGAVKKSIECNKKAIQADSLLEESYQKLMTLYSSKGMYNEALKTYEACKKALKTELKTNPDSRTTAIYTKVLEKVGSSRSATRKGSADRKNGGE
jgi:ATP/maltotriose-dependent transcriptional regulator MalT/DNA-binding SARP family transcriptional activator